MAFRHLFSFRKLWLQALVSIDSESCKSLQENHASLCQSSFPSLSSPPSEVAVLFDRNLSRRPFFSQVDDWVVDWNLLLCKGFDTVLVDFYWCLVFTERPINDCKIEISNERGSDPLKVLAKSIESSLSRAKKRNRPHCSEFTIINLTWNPFWLSNRVSIAGELTGFSRRFCRVFPREISSPSSVQPWKIPVLPAIGLNHRQSRSHWESRGDPSDPYGYYGLWMCQWPRPTWTTHLFTSFQCETIIFFSYNLAKIQFSCRF